MKDNKTYCLATESGERLFDELHRRFAKSSTEDFIKAQISKTGLKYVDQGRSRVVLLDDRGKYIEHPSACVVKINKNGEVDSNITEIRNYNKVIEPAKKYLMKITDYDPDGKWLIMPYVSTEVTDEMMMELEKNLAKMGLRPDEVHPRNCAKVKGRAVLLDYDSRIRRINPDDMNMAELMNTIEWKYED